MSVAAQAGAAAGTPPFARFEWMLAWRYLKARRREGFISVIALFSFLGIMLGVATLIVVLAVMNGFRKELLSKIIGVNGHAFVQPIDGPLTDFDAVTKRLAGVRDVTLVFPLVEGQAFATMPGRGTGVIVRGIREADLKRVGHIANNLRSGTLDKFDEGSDGEKTVIIGSRLARVLGVSVGDSISLLAPDGPATPFGIAPRRKAYEVQAIFEIGMSQFDEVYVFMPLGEAQAYFNRDDNVSFIEIFVADPDKIDAVRPSLEEAMGRSGLITDWRQRNDTLFNALVVERNVMFLILTLMVLVAALNIVSGLIMLVNDKSTAIAVLRTIGATRAAVMRVFLITGTAIGAAGTLAGLGLGILIANNVQVFMRLISWITGANLWDPTVRFLTQVPSELHYGEIAAVVGMSLVLSFLATLYPAWRAARLDPVEALRYG